MDRTNIRQEAQDEIDGTLVARIIMDFQDEMRDVYGAEVMASNLCAVGPLQTMIGLAIKNGRIPSPPRPPRLPFSLPMPRRWDEALLGFRLF